MGSMGPTQLKVVARYIDLHIGKQSTLNINKHNGSAPILLSFSLLLFSSCLLFFFGFTFLNFFIFICVTGKSKIMNYIAVKKYIVTSIDLKVQSNK